jgi:hypothetical protein
MSKMLIALMMFSSYAYAEGVNLPSVEAGQYSEAVNKALKAASIQSGLQNNMDVAAGLASKKATETGNTVITTVTPFNPRDVYFVLGTGYALGVKKEFRKSFKNPLFPNVTNTLEYSGKGEKRTNLIFGVSF